ncbi:MAG: aminoacetone oxidase family FAD-binding enzyme [Gemmatimonadaceae bacterium]|nr:aminoacetone oxidase family FAD-binding enzyme [Gemmatimonadaceae bacterium]
MRHVVVIGAGAAGTMAAIFAARGGARTTLLERTRDGGRKILISGGGRCNVLPLVVDESRFITDSSPNTLRKILRSWPLDEQVHFFEQEIGIPLVEERESLKRFPASHKARDVRDGLLAHARQCSVDIRFDTQVTGFSATAAGWRVDIASGAPLDADAVIVATGGLSVPATGSDGLGLRVLREMGHAMHRTYAALTPLTSSDATLAALSGVSLTVSLTARDTARSASATGGFLFTHHGYSGPSVLDVSHVVVRSRHEGDGSAKVTVRWTDLDEAAWNDALRSQGVRTVAGAVRAQLPDRLAMALIERAAVDPSRTLSELRRDERMRLVEMLVSGPLPWSGDEGYKKAEVTGGGVSLAEVDPRTMESRRNPALFLCGELLDAFGPIGGYNFFWAWTTGRAAGRGAAGQEQPSTHSTNGRSPMR